MTAISILETTPGKKLEFFLVERRRILVGDLAVEHRLRRLPPPVPLDRCVIGKNAAG